MIDKQGDGLLRPEPQSAVIGDVMMFVCGVAAGMLSVLALFSVLN